MILVIEIIAIMVLLITLIVGVKYMLLMLAKLDADRFSNEFYEKLKEHYRAVCTLFSKFTVLSPEDISLVDSTRMMISKASEFSFEKDGNERIIAYANSILKNVQIFIDARDENSPEIEDIKRYKTELAKFSKTIETYNKSAKKLKHYVDVFPTSFIARLKGIKTLDFVY